MLKSPVLSRRFASLKRISHSVLGRPVRSLDTAENKKVIGGVSVESVFVLFGLMKGSVIVCVCVL